MKYVIEIEKRPFRRADSISVDFSEELYRVEGFNSLVFDKHGLDKLEPLTPDYINEHFGELQDQAYRKGCEDTEKLWKCPSSENEHYQKGLEDAWELAKKLIWRSSPKDREAMGIEIETDESEILLNYSVHEALDKLTAYEQKQKEDAERIMFGDGLKTKECGFKCIALSNETNGEVYVWREDCVAYMDSAKRFVKTGETFPELAALLEKMKGE